MQSGIGQFTKTMMGYYIIISSGAPIDRFLSNAFKRCFKLSGVLLKLCRLILGSAKKFFLFGYSRELEYSQITYS